MNLEDNQKKFFLFAYLGITPNEISETDKAIKACVDRAYLDMCRTLSIKNNDFEKMYSNQLVEVLAFEERVLNTKDILIKKRKEAYDAFFEANSDIVKDELKQYLNRKTYTDHTKRHDKEFYYGQAQKWINMALKYMWLVGLIEGEAVEELEAPIDTYVMKAADEAFGILFPVDNNIENWEKYKYNTMPWSKLYKKEYEKIQQSIKDNVTGKYHSVIEWECEAWIEQAKKDKEI